MCSALVHVQQCMCSSACLAVHVRQCTCLEQTVVGAGDVEECHALARDGTHVVGTLHVGRQRRDATGDVLHPLLGHGLVI